MTSGPIEHRRIVWLARRDWRGTESRRVGTRNEGEAIMVTARFLRRGVPFTVTRFFAQKSFGLCIGLLLGGMAAIGCAQNNDSEDSDSEDSQSVINADAVFR